MDRLHDDEAADRRVGDGPSKVLGEVEGIAEPGEPSEDRAQCGNPEWHQCERAEHAVRELRSPGRGVVRDEEDRADDRPDPVAGVDREDRHVPAKRPRIVEPFPEREVVGRDRRRHLVVEHGVDDRDGRRVDEEEVPPSRAGDRRGS